MMKSRGPGRSCPLGDGAVNGGNVGAGAGAVVCATAGAVPGLEMYTRPAPAAKPTARAADEKATAFWLMDVVSNFTSAHCTPRSAHGNAIGQTHREMSSNYLCTNGAELPRCPVDPCQPRGDAMAAKFEITKDHAGKFRFHLKAPNGEIIAASQGYETRQTPRKALRRSRRTRPTPRSKTQRSQNH